MTDDVRVSIAAQACLLHVEPQSGALRLRAAPTSALRSREAALLGRGPRRRVPARRGVVWW
jgi:hypothetical protein